MQARAHIHTYTHIHIHTNTHIFAGEEASSILLEEESEHAGPRTTAAPVSATTLARCVLDVDEERVEEHLIDVASALKAEVCYVYGKVFVCVYVCLCVYVCVLSFACVQVIYLAHCILDVEEDGWRSTSSTLRWQ